MQDKFNIQQITFNTGNTIPVIFIAEGFQETELSVFDTYVQHAIDMMAGTVPFSTNMNKFQFYKVRSTSKESGRSIRTHPARPVTPILKDTYLQAYSNGNGLERLYLIPKDKRQMLYNNLGASNKIFAERNFYPIVIVNDEFYGGSGELTGISPTKGKPDSMALSIVSLGGSVANFQFLVIHEFGGHSFGDLDDEYEDPLFAEVAPLYSPDLWNYPNRRNVFDTDQGGWFEGARYLSTGKWRETASGLMREAGGTFGPLCESLLQERIDAEVGDTLYNL